VLFFVNGALYANWVPRIPDAKRLWSPPIAADRPPSPAEPDPDVPTRRAERSPRRGLVLPTGAVGALGLMALLGGLVEDAPGSWSAVYLREALGASPGMAGLAYATFVGAMTVGRLLDDGAVERFGAVRVLRTGAMAGAAGLATGLLLATPAAAIIGFGLVGIGVSTLFPLVFATAGALADTPSGGAIGMVSLIARAGFLFGPGLIGAIADVAGLSVALGVVVAACVGVAATAGVVARRAVRGA
jgi:fucose permease